MTNSTFSSNSAGYWGGGILSYTGGTVTTVTNSTFSGNTAGGTGGGGIDDSGTMTVTDSTFSGNSAFKGGGIYHDGTLLKVTNTIVAGNTVNGVGSADPDIYGSVDAGSAYNIIGDGTGMSGITNGDANHNQVGTSGNPINPVLDSLQNYGGLTNTLRLQTGQPRYPHRRDC